MLAPDQQAKLEQLWAVTASDTDAKRERDERILRENGWNVELFAMPPQDDAGPSRSTHRPPSQPKAGRAAPSGARRLSGAGAFPGPRRPQVGLGLAGVLAWPFSLILGLLSGAWYFILRTFVPLSLLPRLPRFLLPPPSRPPIASRDPAAAARAYVRDLELLAPSAGAGAGALPDFWVGAYRDFVADVRAQCRVGLVVLTCGEHEDDDAFKREVLCDPEFAAALRENEVMVWAADVREREGYQVAQTLLATTYPSLFFLSLLPVPHSSQPRLQVITHLAGPPSTATSTPSVLQALSTVVLPRASALLGRLRRERAALEESRHLRAQQDAAFREAERRDRARLDAQRREAELARAQAERAQAERDRAARALADARVWRRYARKHLLPPPPAAGAPGSVRVALRTPLDAQRHVRLFAPGDSTLPLFVFAETLLIPPDEPAEGDPDSAPEGYTHAWPFRVVTTYPRREVELVDGAAADEAWAAVRQAGGALFVERVEGAPAWGAAEDGSDDEDVVEDDE